MQIISLACKRCGAPLQIKEETNQLACAHCGAQMHVERGGGTISLQLAEALGSIRTGAVQTAAELALVRLEKEREICSHRIASLGGQNYEPRFDAKDLLSDSELALAQARVAELKSEVARNGNALPLVACVFFLAITIGAIWAWRVHDGFFGVLNGLVPVVIIGFVGLPIAMIVTLSLTSTPNKQLDEVQGKINRHQVALRDQTTLSQLNEARAELARIQEEITRNRNIVSSQ